MAEMATDTEWAYAAGILDGEGCILIAYYKSNYSQFVLRVDIASTHLPLMAWLKECFNGSWCANVTSAKTTRVNRPIYQWKAQARDGYAFLRGCLPYLRIKREEAEVAIRFYSERPDTSPGGRSRPTPIAEWERRRELRVELQRLKGPSNRRHADVPSRAIS